MNIIPASFFQSCVICGCTKHDIILNYPGRENGAYFLNKFCNHLRSSHAMTLQHYCECHLGIEWSRCPVSGTPVGFKANGTGLRLSTYKRWVGVNKAMSPAFRAACERASEARKNAGNPMWGRRAWNHNLPPDHPYPARMAALRKGVVESEETRQKHRENRRMHPRKARHTTPHSANTKEKIARRTAAMHARHAFGRESTPHIRMRCELNFFGIVFAEEHKIEGFCADFAIPDKRVVIEVDGDFFHTNPALYGNGPTCAIQRRTARNDRRKNASLQECGWTVLRYWESDILASGFSQTLRVDLVRLGVL